MRDIDKAIEILQQTKDGSSLDPKDLYLVQCAVNGHLSDAGVEAFSTLYDDVTSGTYTKRWLYDIEGLRREHDGYISWNGVIVEHYSFTDAVREREAAMALAERCRSLEERGYQVSGRSSSTYGPFLLAPANSPWLAAMTWYYTAFMDQGQAKWLILYLPNHDAAAVGKQNGELTVRYQTASQFDSAVYHMFHELSGEGYESCGNRLDTYDGFIACMAEIGLTPGDIDKIIAESQASKLKAA